MTASVMDHIALQQVVAVISRGEFEGGLAGEPRQLNGRAPGQISGGQSSSPGSGSNFSFEI